MTHIDNRHCFNHPHKNHADENPIRSSNYNLKNILLLGINMVMDGYHSQDRLSKLRDKINKQHLNYLVLEEVPEKHEIRLKLLDTIREYLLISPPDQKFYLHETSSILHLSARNPSFNGFKAASGWDAIAKYASNLLSQPWRTEYRVIKTYSGYYKHSIETNLDGAEQIFEVMGYKMEEDGELVLDDPVCPDQVTCVSIDALFAYVECQILNEIFDDIYHTGVKTTWLDVLEFRDSHICSPKEIARALIYTDNNAQYQQQQQQQHVTYSNNAQAQAHAQQQLSDSGVYYNNVLGGYSRRSVSGNGVIVTHDSTAQPYGNIQGHALAAAYSFAPLRHHTQAQYYPPTYDLDYYSRCSRVGSGANTLIMQPFAHDMYPTAYHTAHAPVMYHSTGIVLKQQHSMSCCSNGYVPDLSVPSTAAIAPIAPNCLCVPTGQLIDLDNSSQHHTQSHIIAHDTPDGPPTTNRTRMRTPNTHTTTTYINGNTRHPTHSNHHQQHHSDTAPLANAHAHAHDDTALLSGGDKEVPRGGDRDLRVEEGAGTYESWDYVYKNLESQGYSKDLGERGDILDRSGKRRPSPSPHTKTTTDIPATLNGLTLTTNTHHKQQLHLPYERRNSDETQTSHYDNVPATRTAPSTVKPPHTAHTLMQQKMKANKLSEVKAKVDSRRSVTTGKGDESKCNGSGGKDTNSRLVEGSHPHTNGLKTTNRNTAHSNKQQSPPLLVDSNMKSSRSSMSAPTAVAAPSTPPPMAPTSWECSSCTFLNSFKDICEMCDKSRDVALLDTSMEIGGPQCVTCTLVNPKGAAICQVCDKSLINSPTYI